MARIEHLWVIRRDLHVPNADWAAPAIRKWAHSAVLVRTSDGMHWIIEYLNNGAGHGRADCYPVTFEVANGGDGFEGINVTTPGKEPIFWTKQKNGVPVAGNTNPAQAATLMNEEMGAKYNALTANCHDAQEKLRKKLGLTVQ